MALKTPSVAVVIPNYNQAQFLPRAIASVVWQLWPQDELVVVDDGSAADLSADQLAPFANRILLLRNGTRRGASYTRNRGIARSRADWIKFLDADDVLAPFTLQIVRDYVFPDEVKVLIGGCHRIIDGRYADYLDPRPDLISQIKQHFPTMPSCVFVQRQALLEVGMFDERIDLEEDWDLWLRLHERYGRTAFAIVQQPFCYYWINETERKAKTRTGQVEGMPVREYFRIRYGADPQ